jgi:hypothetical protein
MKYSKIFFAFLIASVIELLLRLNYSHFEYYRLRHQEFPLILNALQYLLVLLFISSLILIAVSLFNKKIASFVIPSIIVLIAIGHFMYSIFTIECCQGG